MPEPARSMMDTLGDSSARISQLMVRQNLSGEVRSQVGEFCQQCHDIENSVPFNTKADAYAKDYRPVVDHRDVPKEKRTVVPK